MNDDLTHEDIGRAADDVVEELLASAGVTCPPVDALVLARHLGIAAREKAPSDKRDTPSPEAQQWTAAQAVGARLKPDLLRRLGLDPAFRTGLSGESLPDLLARRLLTPTSWFADDARGCGWDVPELKRLYATAGYEVVAWRLLDLPTPCVITIVDNGHIRRRRSNAWRVTRTLHPAERECQRYVNHYSRPRVVAADGWTVQGWPVHAPDWKREILRSVADAE